MKVYRTLVYGCHTIDQKAIERAVQLLYLDVTKFAMEGTANLLVESDYPGDNDDAIEAKAEAIIMLRNHVEALKKK